MVRPTRRLSRADSDHVSVADCGRTFAGGGGNLMLCPLWNRLLLLITFLNPCEPIGPDGSLAFNPS